jgi:type IV secretion system protein VirB10
VPEAREQPQPDLDANVPHITSSDMRRMNRRALGLLASIASLLAVIGAWAFGGLGREKPMPAPAREEVVTVPEAPFGAAPPAQDPPRPAPLIPAAPLAPRAAEPIPLIPRPKPRDDARDMLGLERPHNPTLLERRMAAADQGTTGVAKDMQGYIIPGATGAAGAAAARGPERSSHNNLAYTGTPLPDVSSAAPLTHPDTLMLRGTFIRCVLETRIVTDIPGFTSCIVTEPVYSFTGRRLLLPKGSKVLGKYEMEPDGPRVAVIWDRIVTPTGIDVNMASPGIDALGGAGHPGHYNAHWGSRIGAAMLISLLSDAFKYGAAKHGPTQTTISNGLVTQTPFESNTADTVQQIARQAVRRAASRPATVTINQGSVMAIYVARDVDFADVVARY